MNPALSNYYYGSDNTALQSHHKKPILIDPFRQKTPLPCVFHGLLSRCFSTERLDALFEQHAQVQYIREVTFSTVCDVMLDVVLKIHPSVHAAYQKRQEPLGITVSALYEKLKGVVGGLLGTPAGYGVGFVEDTR